MIGFLKRRGTPPSSSGREDVLSVVPQSDDVAIHQAPIHREVIPLPEAMHTVCAAIRLPSRAVQILAVEPRNQEMAVWRARRAVIAVLRERTEPESLLLRETLAASPELVARLNSPDHIGQFKQQEDRVAQEQKSDVVRLFDYITHEALKAGASDIQVRVTPENHYVHLRIHGRMVPFREYPEPVLRAMISAVYHSVAANDGKAVTFNPKEEQPAQIDRHYGEQRVIIRFQSLPTVPDGFDVSMRLLPVDVDSAYIPFDRMGYSNAQIQAINLAIRAQQGGIFIAGTTGSGKSTTLQNMMRRYIEINGGTKLVRTAEDPVEYIIPGASQSAVPRPRPGEDEEAPYVRVFNALMRANPDLIMIGEVRGKTMGKLLSKAILTGHLTATTVHASGLFAIVKRLEQVGISPDDMADRTFFSALEFQRLAPTLCPHCKEPLEDALRENRFSRELMRRIDRVTPSSINPTMFVEHPGGCDHCRIPGIPNSGGVSGRTACCEIVIPDETMLEFIGRRQYMDLERYWREGKSDDFSGYGRTAMEHAMAKMWSGLVSPVDVERTFDVLTKHDIMADGRIESHEIEGANFDATC